MPLVHIHLMEGRSQKEIRSIADSVQKALGQAWKFKVARFQVIHEHKKSHFLIDRGFGGYKYTDQAVIITVFTLKLSKEKKRKTYAELSRMLKKWVLKDDLLVNLIEVAKMNFCVGGGVPL